ncbi:MAG TPA: hypothetical protein VHI93_08740 [Candidatus Thermoplasmatota archaeon]|nr:hypothetical protein [Candidatus Thermoplasmatota archaeon]
MTRRWLPLLLLVPTLGLLAATRLPRPGWLGLAFGAGTVAAVALALLASRPTAPRWVAAALSFSVLALFLVPPVGSSYAPGLPSVLPPLAALLLLSAIHPQARAQAPGASDAGLGARLRRSLPLALPVAAVLALPPLLRGSLPDRLALLHELDGAALPLLAAALVAIPILVVAWLRDAAPLWLERRRKEDAP